MPTYDVTVEGTTYEVNAPDENTAWRWANYTHRQRKPAAPAAKPESGFFPALRSGATELGGGISALLGKLGLKDEATAQAEFDAAQKRAKEIFAPTEAGWTEAPVAKTLELLGGSIPYMAAPLAAGAAAAALPLTGTLAVGTALGAAGLTSAAQFTATNLSRQMEEGKKLADTDLGNAALAAVPMALLDTAAMRLIPGIGRIFGQAGIKVTPETAKEIAEQALKKTLIDYTAATGKTMGVEGLTEATQQVLERAQAGLSLTDPKARDEYFDSFIGGAVLGGTLAVPGRYLERSDAQGKARELLDAQEAEKRKVAAAAEQARRASPDYLESVFTAYDTLAKQDAALKAQIKKGSKEAPLSQEDKDANAVINKQLEALKSPLEQARKEYLAAGGPQALAKMRAGQLELTSPEGRVSEPVATEEIDEEKTARLRRDLPGLESLLARQLQDVKSAATPEEALTLAQRAAATRKAVDTARAAAPAEPKIDETELTKRIKRLEKQYQDTREKGDEAAVMKVAPELIAAREEVETLRKQREAQRMDTGLFAPEAVAAEEARRVALVEEMGAGREAAAYERLQSRLEQETAREEDARRAQVDAELAAEGTAEREAMQELAQDLAYRQRMRGYSELGREQQFELFPQPREKVEQKTADIASELRKLQERIAELEKRRAEKQALPQEELAGALSREPGQIVDIDKRLAEMRQRLKDLRESDLERRTVRVLPEAPQVDVRKKPKLAQQVAALADRVVAAPGVDEQTKDVVRQIQADVPGFLRAATAQTAESVREQERRAAATKTGAPAESFAAPTTLFNPSQVATWLYRTLTTGRADPADTARALAVLRTLQELPAAGQQRLSSIRPAPMGEALAEARKLREKKPAPVKKGTTLAEREARDAAKRRAEQSSLEAGERAGVMVFFEKNKEDIMADTNYIKLVEQSYDTNLSTQERMKAAEEADKYMQEKRQRIEARAEKTAAASQLHEENLKNARDKLAKLKELRGTKRTDATKAKLEEAIKKQEAVVAGHQAKLNKALTGTKITRMSRGDLKAIRDKVHADVREEVAQGRRALFSGTVEGEGVRTVEPGERLGVAEGTQQRAIGPATRAEVVPPKTLRTGSEESRAGETTTPARNRIQEARGVKQRDVPITSVELAESGVTAAEIALEQAKKSKALVDAQKQKDKVAATIAQKGASPSRTRALRKAEQAIVKNELPVRIAEKSLEENRLLLEIAREGSTKARTEQRTVLQNELAALVRQADAAATEKLKMERIRSKKRREIISVERGRPEDTEYEAPEIEILGGPRKEVYFSRGATANPSTTDSVRTELKLHFSDLGRVQVYDSVEALVKANPQYEGRIPDDARGFVDRAGNKAFLIAGNINQGQALSVLLHEVGAHIGMKNLLGDAQYNAFVNAVERWQKAPATSAEGRVARAAQARVEAAETPESQQRDELLAYAVEEAVNAGITPQTKSPLGQWLGRIVQRMEAAVRKFFGMEPKGISLRDLVNTAYGAAKVEMQPAVASAPASQPAEAGEILFSRNLPTASRVASNLVGGQKGFVDKLRDNFLGMGVRTQYIDKLFPTEEALKRGGVNDKDAMQAMYYLRMYDQRMHFTSQAMTVGVPERVEKTQRDGTKEFLIEAKDGANLKQAFDILKRKDVVKEAGSADNANKLVTLYMAAIRGERVGYDTLNFGRAWASAEIARIEGELKSPKLSAEQRTNLTKRRDRLSKRLDSMPSPADIKAAKAEIDANPVLREAFNEVRDIYNQYNRDLLNFNVQTGAISRELANKLLQESDYIPYYRVRDGVAELLIGKETPIRIGNLKDSPHLQELVGGDEPVMDFITSSIQNTSMLIDMATHNLAMRNLMFEFRDVGLATIGKTKGGKAPEGAVTFKVDGVEHYGVVDTEMLGISSDLLVKGLAGIPTMFPTMIRVMGMPARFLRRLIVASPVYMARQLFRDSLGASIASGANTVPVLSALKQIGKTDVLEKRGITGGQVFTGMPEDMSRMIKDMQAGKISFNNGLAWLESKAAQADALTRRSQYESYLQQGLSEMEATYMALESMNFSRRGLSPSIHMASALIPFFNTQIQGLDVLYRSFRGKMPMNERLNVRRKLIVRGMMLFGLSFAYALAMQDDEAYKNAKPEDKYGNWFVPLDMFGIKEPLRLPIPFELGYFFKALPEAIVNIATNEKGAEEAQKALKHIGQQIVPGLSNFFIPQAVKPALEVAFGTSLYTGRDIEPAREQGVEPGYRTQSSTTELAKAVGEMTGFSPIKLEFLIRGYTGQMGMAAIAALSAPFAGAGEGPAPATKRYSDLPLIGTLFQPKDASGIVDLVYERMNKVRQAQETYERFISEGKQEKAAQYAKEKADELSLASMAGAFRQQMGEITDYERRVRASNLSPERKREELDRAIQAKITLSKTVQAMSGRRTPQAAPA